MSVSSRKLFARARNLRAAGPAPSLGGRGTGVGAWWGGREHKQHRAQPVWAARASRLSACITANVQSGSGPR